METNIPSWLDSFYNHWKKFGNKDTLVSHTFLKAMDELLPEDLVRQTGKERIKSKSVLDSMRSVYVQGEPVLPEFADLYVPRGKYELIFAEYSFTNGVSCLTASLSVYAHQLSKFVRICWQEKNGREIKPNDSDFDVKDLTMWFEGLDIAEITAIYNETKGIEGEKLKRLKNLSYTLEIDYFSIDLRMELYFKEKNTSNVSQIVNQIYDKIND